MNLIILSFMLSVLLISSCFAGCTNRGAAFAIGYLLYFVYFVIILIIILVVSIVLLIVKKFFYDKWKEKNNEKNF